MLNVAAHRVLGSWGAVGVALFFFLSGYGNYFSAKKNLAFEALWKKKLAWLGWRIARLLVSFLFCFLAAIIVREFFKPEAYDIADYLLDLFTLKMPGTTTWYFKIQILLYCILWVVSCFAKKKTWMWVGLLTVIYIMAAVRGGLSDYWWKTAMCFSAGLCVGEYKGRILIWVEHHRIKMVVGSISAALVGYAYVILAHGFQPVLQNIAFCMLSTGVCIVVTMLQPNTRTMFHSLDSFTLELYLIHIGILGAIVYEGCPDFRIGLYIGLSIVLAAMIHLLDDRIIGK